MRGSTSHGQCKEEKKEKEKDITMKDHHPEADSKEEAEEEEEVGSSISPILVDPTKETLAIVAEEDRDSIIERLLYLALIKNSLKENIV